MIYHFGQLIRLLFVIHSFFDNAQFIRSKHVAAIEIAFSVRDDRVDCFPLVLRVKVHFKYVAEIIFRKKSNY